MNQTALLAALNTFRRQTGVPEAQTNNALANAAVNHAGYQGIKARSVGTNAALTHFETTNNEPRGTADTANAMFTGVRFENRIAAVNGGSGFIAGASREFEDVSTAGGAAGVDSLWNTVYHRIPMMRDAVVRVGLGDQAMARSSVAPGASALPASGNAFCTIEFAEIGSLVAARVASHWPQDGQTGVETTFLSFTEGPNPAPDRDGITNRNPVGGPIHVVFPTLRAFASITASVRDGSTTLPARILVGVASGEAVPAGTGVQSDPQGDDFLDRGELFIMTESAMPTRRRLTVNVSATTVAPAQTFTAAFSFTTR